MVQSMRGDEKNGWVMVSQGESRVTVQPMKKGNEECHGSQTLGGGDLPTMGVFKSGRITGHTFIGVLSKFYRSTYQFYT